MFVVAPKTLVSLEPDACNVVFGILLFAEEAYS